MLLSLKRVLGRIAYLSGAIIVSFLVFLIIVWSSNFSGIWQVVSSSSFDFFEKLNFLWSFIPSITTNYTAFSAFYLLLISVLTGLNVAAFMFYVKQRRRIKSDKSVRLAGIGGAISAVFGIGCAACGAALIAPLLALLGAGGVLAALPFDGQEFGAVSVLLLLFSLVVLLRRINDPLVCPVDLPDIKK